MSLPPVGYPMAASPFVDIFDIYNDATATPRTPSGLPCGGCNFADLTPGASGLKCGCRRFWARHVPGSPVPDQAGWCMCNHHACYHDRDPSDAQPPPLAPAHGQENERHRTGREPLSPVPGIPSTTLPAPPDMDFTSFGDLAPLSFVHDLPEDYPHHSRGNASQHPGSLPDTLAWGDLIHSPAPAITSPLPPIPSQCLIPSQTASTAPSIQARYLRPFAGKGLQTLSSIGDPRARPSARQPTDTQAPTDGPDAPFVLVQSATQRGATSRPGSATHTQSRAAHADPRTVRDLASTVSQHTHRLDRLETVSFHEECHDKMENLDVRMSELESRVDEVERLANDNASVVTARAARDEDVATQSIASASTSFATRTQADADVLGHIHSLQAQVAQLQSYLPSPQSAWVVEVVFLPFPLKRLWQEIHQFRSDSAADGDDWTQLPMTLSTASRRSQSPFYSYWATSGHDAEWLLPRACSNTSIMDKRLRSRGLIQTVSVKGPDYRSVQAAVHTAFGGVFRELRLASRAHPSDARAASFLGLHQLWVPLRKVHKDSRLRFLSPAEMMTPSLWDVQFLSCVMMRSSEPRLFITHPDAYLQDEEANAAGCTWQWVREMTRVYPDVTESAEVPEADALEEYWAWTEQLDESPSARAPLSMRRDRQRASMSPLLARGPVARSWRRSVSPVVTRGQSPLTARWRDSAVPPLIRTASVPVVAPAGPSPTTGGRRVASHGQSRRPSPTMRVTSQARVVKKRRTRSPSHQQHHFTPRWTASPSPMLPSLTDRQAPRGMTPFAYATPHSNAPLHEIRLLRGSSTARTSTMNPPEPEYVLPDVDLYGSVSDESYVDDEDDDDDDDDEEDGGESDGVVARRLVLDSQQWHLPEDEPWPGIEDQDGIVEDGENVDPREQDDEDGDQSASSSQPSEYPSTNPPWPNEDASEFRIHEDE